MSGSISRSLRATLRGCSRLVTDDLKGGCKNVGSFVRMTMNVISILKYDLFGSVCNQLSSYLYGVMWVPMPIPYFMQLFRQPFDSDPKSH